MFKKLNLKDEYITVIADNRIIISHSWFYDNEVGETIMNHLRKVTEAEKELWEFLEKKIASKLQSEG